MSPQPKSHEPPEPEEESEELLRFREQWRREVEQNRRKAAEEQGNNESLDYTSGPSGQASTATEPSKGTSSQTVKHSVVAKETIFGAHSGSLQYRSHGTTDLASNSMAGMDTAVEIYRRAVQHEQRSELDAALRLYRDAFRKDPNVDKAYYKLEQQMHTSASTVAASRHGHTRSKSDSGAIENITQEVAKLSVTHIAGGMKGLLASALADFPQELTFEPEDERQPVVLNNLPDEIIIIVLRCLETSAIERFAAVCRKARILTLEISIWKDFVEMTYRPPQISDEVELYSIVDMFQWDYRRMYIEHPRVRLDGVYIAVCHYVRPGLSENAWVNVNHLITYHRYLRFFPDGQVLSLLANEELDPQQVVPLLKPTLRMKGLFIGEWALDDRTVYVTNLSDASDASKLPVPTTFPSASTSTATSHANPNATSYATRYVFQMTLNLQSRPLGKWNKLEFSGYDSIDLGSGETIPLSLKHERPYHFSKVRSYAV